VVGDAIVSTLPKNNLTPEQYLEIERQAEFKSEYYRGEMFAKAGASVAHNVIVGNMVGELRQNLRSNPCTVLPSDMRVHIKGTDLYTYPDAVVFCGQPQLLDNKSDTLLNPTLIVEVLSPSTEAFDRGRKFEHYSSIETLTSYLMVASDRIHADQYTRQPGGAWLRKSYSTLEETIDLATIGCTLSMTELYAKVEFGELPPGARRL
jgi:Uma2 family endonuclease